MLYYITYIILYIKRISKDYKFSNRALIFSMYILGYYTLLEVPAC